MMSTILYLVRHGFTDFDEADSIGRKQIEDAGDVLGSLQVGGDRTLLISSELQRGLVTSDILKEKLRLRHAITREALNDTNYEQTFTFLSKMVEAQGQRFDNIIAVTHLPNIYAVVKVYVGLYHTKDPGSAPNGAVFRIASDEKIVERIFAPAFAQQ